MLIRFIIKNIYSFGEQREFNMLPSPRYSRLNHHKYSLKNFKFLKMAAIYGANGAGKSNLINAISYLKKIITGEQIPKKIIQKKYKFLSPADKSPIIFGIEFIQNEKAFYYSLEIIDTLIITEELYESGLGSGEDKLIFKRELDKSNKISLKFFNDFYSNEENIVLQKVIEKNLSKPDKPIIKLLTTLENPFFSDIKSVYNWFRYTLQIIRPSSKPIILTEKLDKDLDFKHFAENLICSFNTGINKINLNKRNIKEFYTENEIDNMEKLINELDSMKNKILSLRSYDGEEIILVKEGNEVYVKKIELEHTGKNEIVKPFNLDEESDGTKRLLDFIPALKGVISKQKVYIIDEIERSIHPLLIKEIVNKFSIDKTTKGQLIFSTHESNLLDQETFRQDEIWFVEKDNNGSTDLYSLSDFKEHNTIDIRKGYLSGRYGSIPFLGNLKDLNWHSYDN